MPLKLFTKHDLVEGMASRRRARYEIHRVAQPCAKNIKAYLTSRPLAYGPASVDVQAMLSFWPIPLNQEEAKDQDQDQVAPPLGALVMGLLQFPLIAAFTELRSGFLWAGWVGMGGEGVVRCLSDLGCALGRLRACVWGGGLSRLATKTQKPGSLEG